MLSRIFIISSVLLGIWAQFNIPLLFGNLSFNKKDNGEVDVNLKQDVNIFGFGGNRNTTLSFGNGTFHANNTQNALVNGTNFGGGGAVGFDKEKGVNVDSQLNLANETVHGGLGKETSFFEGLLGAVKKLKEKTQEDKKNKAAKTFKTAGLSTTEATTTTEQKDKESETNKEN